VAEDLEWLDLFFLCIPRDSFRVYDTGSHAVRLHLRDSSDDIWVFTGVVFRVSAVDVNITVLKDVYLQSKQIYRILEELLTTTNEIKISNLFTLSEEYLSFCHLYFGLKVMECFNAKLGEYAIKFLPVISYINNMVSKYI
jgi:hypothetical protein